MPTIQELTTKQIRAKNSIIDGAITPFDISLNTDNTKIDIAAASAYASWSVGGVIKEEIIEYAGQTAYSPVFGSGLVNDYFVLYIDKSDLENVAIAIANNESYADIDSNIAFTAVFYAVITRDPATDEIISYTVDYNLPCLVSPPIKNRVELLQKGSDKISGYIVEAETSNYGSVVGSYLKLGSGLAETAGRGDELDFSNAYTFPDESRQGAITGFESSSLGGRGEIGQIITNRPAGSDAKLFISEKPWYEPEDGTTLKYIGAINVSSDFPVSPEEDDCYEMNANVTDNDPLKTNTGQVFVAGEVYKWDGTSAWVDTGYRQVPTGKVVVYKAKIFPGSKIIVLLPSKIVFDTFNDAKHDQHIIDTDKYSSLQRFIPMVDCSYDNINTPLYISIKDGFDPTLDWDNVANTGLYEFFGKSTLDTSSAPKVETLTTQGLGNGTFYNFGFYETSSTSVILTQASPTQAFADANCAHASHAFIVAGGVGTASGGTGAVEIEVSGTSITDEGVRVAGDTEVVVADITALSLNQYLETNKKWIGEITYTIKNATGSTQTTFSANFNYGLAAYEDFGNQDFVVKGFIVNGLAGANDTGWNVELLHHKSTGWTYATTGFIPGDGSIVDVNNDYVTEKNLTTGEPFRYKRVGLTKYINGSGEEGLIVRTTTSVNNSIEIQNMHIGVNIV